MVFCLVHLDDAVGKPPEEEVLVVVPDAPKTAVAIPLGALPHLLPILERAVGRPSAPRCPACDAALSRPHHGSVEGAGS